MKYIIEIEDVPFSKVRIDADNGAQNINLYRAKGFNSLVFDRFGLDKLTPLNKELEEAYQKGYNEAKLIYQNPNAESDYQRGLDDGRNETWDVAKKIALMDTETSENVTGYFGLFRIMDNLTASEAIAKLKAYEEQQKADFDIKVGDEVKDRTDDCGVVTGIYGNDTYVLWQDGSTGDHAADELIKTGRHFNFLTPLLNEMKEGAE